NDLLKEKGFLTKPPFIPVPKKADFVKKQSYLNGFFGNVRSLHALEITHLYDNIENDATSKALLIGFSQVSKNEEVRKFLLRGKEMATIHLGACLQHLDKEILPSSPLVDDVVSTSTFSPFSDKFMLWHIISMFYMKVRSYANGASLNGR